MSEALLHSMLRLVDRTSEGCGRAVAWLTPAMVLLTFVVVVLRYLFDLGWIWLQELTTWMHAMVFLLGAAYTLQAGEHVRVDVLYRRMSASGRAWVDLAGGLLLLAPTCGYLLWTAAPYGLHSWLRHEGSRETGGLPFPFVPLAKTAIVVMALLVLIQGLAIAARAAMMLAGRMSREAAGYADERPGAHEL